jgi:hypothetical protein
MDGSPRCKFWDRHQESAKTGGDRLRNLIAAMAIGKPCSLDWLTRVKQFGSASNLSGTQKKSRGKAALKLNREASDRMASHPA